MEHFAVVLVVLAFIITVASFSTDPNDVRFYFYPNTNTRNEIKWLDAESINRAGFVIGKPVVFVLHGGNTGYHDYDKDPYVNNLKEEYLKQGKSNVIGVDYSKLVSVDPNPLGVGQAVLEVTLNVQITGKRVADFINFLLVNARLQLRDVHLVGWSLGAQVAGVTGAEVRILTGGELVGRISGLDPMGLTFGPEFRQPDQRLDASDANFVDITYTSSSNSITPLNVIGHANFYPNAINAKGNNFNFEQPGCPFNIFNVVGTFWCSHEKGYKYFARSINGPSIQACKCSSVELNDCKQDIAACPNKVVYGENVPAGTNGIFYMRT